MSQVLEDETLLRVGQLVNTPDKPAKGDKPAKTGKRGILGISRTSYYRLVSKGKFPKPVRIMDNIVAHPLKDVRAWLKSHVAA